MNALRVALGAVFLSACASAPVKWPAAPAVELSPKKILVVVTSNDRFGAHEEKTGFWLSEVTHFYEVVTAAGYAVDFVSPLGGAPPCDARSDDRDEPSNKAFLADEVNARLLHSKKPDEVNIDEYVAIYFAGGHGPMFDLPENEPLKGFTRAMYERGGVVSAVCHGPAGLLNVKLSDGTFLLAGKNVTGLSNMEEWLSGKQSLVPFSLEDQLGARSGGKYVSTFPFSEHVEVSGRVITGQNPGSTRKVAEALVKALAK
ncbi:MAG: type 1 glutamine amidotransferase domain-containing protein [Archangium sp.]